MNLREEILSAHSKVQAQKLAGRIGDHPARFAALVDLLLRDEYRVVQRAAWIISMVAAAHPALVTPHLPALVTCMEEPHLPAAVKRNVVRILQHITIPEALHGQVMHICFGLLENPEETIAVRAFSMTVLANLAVTYPDIKGELRLVIQEVLAHGGSTAGIRSRAGKVLAAIGKG